jgi:RimJ/RimL family protein N-acetyltransferase
VARTVTSRTTIAVALPDAGTCDASRVTSPDLPVAWERTADAADYGDRLLTGTAVHLRATAEADLPLLESWWLDPAVAALQSDAVRPCPTGPIAERFRSWSTNDTDGAVGFSVVSVDTGELAGHASLWGATVRRRCATLGVLLGPEHRGRGRGRETVRLMLRYGFQEMGLHRVQLEVWAFNDRALRCYRSAGFVEEGRRRQVTFHDGRWHDEVLMAVLRSEWSAGTLDL